MKAVRVCLTVLIVLLIVLNVVLDHHRKVEYQVVPRVQRPYILARPKLYDFRKTETKNHLHYRIQTI